MTFESACAYLERLKNDKEFTKRISKFINGKEKEVFILQEGFEFTQEELSIVEEDY